MVRLNESVLPYARGAATECRPYKLFVSFPLSISRRITMSFNSERYLKPVEPLASKASLMLLMISNGVTSLASTI